MLSYAAKTWIDVDLDKLTDNYRTACGMTDSLVTCVMKSNAYGHGAVRVAQALQEAGCCSFAVSCAREALELRRHGIEGEILVMGLTEMYTLSEAIRAQLTLTVASVEDIRAAECAGAQLDMPVNVHIKVDTGFHRLGFDCTEEAAEAIAACAAGLRYVRLTGLYSHLGLITRDRDAMQHGELLRMQTMLAARGVMIGDIHICDSIGLVRYPAWHHSRVRVGAMLFGVKPGSTAPFDCHETLAFRTTVAQVRRVAAGEPVGYSDDMVMARDSLIATLCVGYGDGYPRHLSNGRGMVMIRGQLAPVVGLVCMDQMMVDVTDIPGVQAGDTVDLLGGGLDYSGCADRARTNRNECISILSRRPVRVYHQHGKIVTVLDELTGERRDEA
ncbi:MAG: alanine racemase [Clostridia bacterium]|nr:alanine racemase [Clostridia bacterium]